MRDAVDNGLVRWQDVFFALVPSVFLHCFMFAVEIFPARLIERSISHRGK